MVMTGGVLSMRMGALVNSVSRAAEAGFDSRSEAVTPLPRRRPRDRASLTAALKGARYLVHAAADYRLWARDPKEIARNNLEGTRLIMEEALRSGVERIVYTSSVATLKPIEGGSASEDRPLAEDEGIGAYKRSKVAAERLVEMMIQREGLPAVIVNPSTPIGPRDVKLGGAAPVGH